MNSSWPEENFREGEEILVRRGRVRVGHIVAIKFKGGTTISRLLRREKDGQIEIIGRLKCPHVLKEGEYEINERAKYDRMNAGEEVRYARQAKKGGKR